MAFLDVEKQKVLDMAQAIESDCENLLIIDDLISYPVYWLIKEDYKILDAGAGHLMDDDKDYTYILFGENLYNITPPSGFHWELNNTLLKSEALPEKSWDEALMVISKNMLLLHEWIVNLKKQERLYS